MLPHVQPGRSSGRGRAAILAADDVRWPSRHFLAEPVQFRSGTGDTVLLGCVCGFAEGGPLTARVEVTAATVMWRNFRSGHRDWDLSALGTLVFDRKQCERASPGTPKEQSGNRGETVRSYLRHAG